MNLPRLLIPATVFVALHIIGGAAMAVAGESATLVNLALRQNARQSSTGFGGDAQRAVDGDTNGNYAGNSVSHTLEEKEAWWEVDLGRVQEIREIRIWNRTDEHGDRLVNFCVLISERPFASNSLGAALQDPGIWQGLHSGMAGATTVIKAKVPGRYVRVQLRQTNFLALAEVQVMGLAADEESAPALAWTGPEEVLFKLESVAAVQNNPPRKTLFSVDAPTTITRVWTYHWNDGRGADPGTIGLKNVDTGEMLGSWPAVAFNRNFDYSAGTVWPSAGDGPPHRYWTVQPNLNVPAGTYEVVDSDRATWSTNGEMKNMGAAWVYGRPLAPAPRTAAASSPPAASLANFALKKPARQSSTGFGGGAERAVDGNTNGNFSGNSVSHTGEEMEAWWEVDLGRVQAIREIRLWNRTDEHGERLANFYVLVSERPFAASRLGAILQDRQVWHSEHPGAAGQTTTIPANTKGRYVRVQLRNTNYLSLAEVEVMGPLAGETITPSAGIVPNKAEPIDAVSLTADIGRFRALAAIQPTDAWKRYLTEGAFQRLPEVQRTFFGAIPPEIGWSYFFHAALYVVCPYTNDVAVAFFYHPWSDTGLVTLWQRLNGRSLLIRADVVPGDMLRNPSATKMDLPPAWLRQVDQMTPLITLPLAAGETLRAFTAMFPAEAARLKTPLRNATRDQFQAALDNAALMQTFGAVASVRLGKCLDGLQRYAVDRNLTPYREATERIHAQLSRGDFSALAGPSAETLPETLVLLLRLQPQLAGYSVVAFAASPQSCQVFLSHPAEPKNVLSFWFEPKPDQIGLRRVDFINHDLGVVLGDKLRSLVDAAMAADPAASTRSK